MAEKQQSLRSRLTEKRPAVFALLLLLTGLVLLLLCKCTARKPNRLPEEAITAYRQGLEDRLKTLLQGMDGVGEARVFVTLEQGFETVYAGGRDRVEKIREPDVKGVVVVCRGGADRSVRSRVTEAVATALGISWDRVSVQLLGR